MIKIDSPIANLVQVLEKIKQNAEKYKDRLYKNEAATRATLIDPIIQKLGWDTCNPDMVEFEKFLNDTRIDYALYGEDKEVKIIVEAKALGGNLNDTKITYKIFSYAFNYGIQNIFLTNGVIWHHFSGVKPGIIDPVVIDISKDNLFDISKYFISHFDAALFWQQNEKETSIVDQKQKEHVFKAIPDNTNINLSDWVQLSNLPKELKGTNPPKFIRLPDESEIRIQYWRDILYQTSLFVLKNTNNIMIPLQDQAGKKINIFDIKAPTNPNVAFKKFNYKGQDISIYLNYSSNDCIKNSLYLINFLPKDTYKFPVSVYF